MRISQLLSIGNIYISGVGTNSTLRGRGEARRAEPGGSWGGTVSPSPPAMRSGERCKLPQWGPGRRVKSFGAFWTLQLSAPAVLLLDLRVIHYSFCGSARKFSGSLAGSSRKISNYCGGEKTLSPPRFQHCGGERPRCPRGSDAFVMIYTA